jgi:hypothetical protein
MSLLEDARRYQEFLQKYGQPVEIPAEEAKKQDLHNIWTLWSRSSDFFVNELVEADEVISHWFTPRPWEGKAGEIFYTSTIWVDCPTCANMLEEDDEWDQDECSECEGSGTLSIDLEDCAEAKTEEEVFAKRYTL